MQKENKPVLSHLSMMVLIVYPQIRYSKLRVREK